MDYYRVVATVRVVVVAVVVVAEIVAVVDVVLLYVKERLEKSVFCGIHKKRALFGSSVL